MPSRRAPAVFVSSTCYDLRQVRSDLKGFIEGVGFEPLLSEYDSFPVDPASTTIDNCRRVVEEHADLFVLIVGGRYGSVSDTGKSITNIEYLQARAKGIPIYAFVQTSILNILPVWKRNPDAAFDNVVDSPLLFEFVSSLRDSGKVWTYGFDTAQDVVGVLRKQWANMFVDMLVLKAKIDDTGLPESLRDLRGQALRLVIERPFVWEAQLFGHVLCDGLKAVAAKRQDMTHGISFSPVRHYDGAALCGYASEQFLVLVRIAHNLAAIIEKVMPDAAGGAGQQGDPGKIVYAAQRMVDCYVALIDWTTRWKAVEFDEDFRSLVEVCEGSSLNMIKQLEAQSVEFLNYANNFASEGRRKGAAFGFTFHISIEDPDAVTREVARIAERLNSRLG